MIWEFLCNDHCSEAPEAPKLRPKLAQLARWGDFGPDELRKDELIGDTWMDGTSELLLKRET